MFVGPSVSLLLFTLLLIDHGQNLIFPPVSAEPTAEKEANVPRQEDIRRELIRRSFLRYGKRSASDDIALNNEGASHRDFPQGAGQLVYQHKKSDDGAYKQYVRYGKRYLPSFNYMLSDGYGGGENGNIQGSGDVVHIAEPFTSQSVVYSGRVEPMSLKEAMMMSGGGGQVFNPDQHTPHLQDYDKRSNNYLRFG